MPVALSGLLTWAALGLWGKPQTSLPQAQALEAMWYRDRMQAKEHRDPTSCMTLSRYLTWPGLRAYFCELVTTAEAAGSPSLSAQPIPEADFRQLPTSYLHAGLCQRVFPRWKCSLLWDCRKC